MLSAAPRVMEGLVCGGLTPLFEGFMWTFLALSVATLIALTCCGNLAQRFPINLILLFVFTVFESLCLGGVSAMYACNAPFNEL